MEWLSRTAVLLGDANMEKLKSAHVLIVGLGGVGSWAAEMIVRAGIGQITLVDGDFVKPSNRNRQLPALVSTEHLSKVEVMVSRLLDINPRLIVNPVNGFVTSAEISNLLGQGFNYVLDAIDSLTPKVDLIVETLKRETPLISSMGAGGKMDPSRVQVSDISKSYGCRLASVVRDRLKTHGIKKGFDVVFSPELVNKSHLVHVEGERYKKTTAGTISYMPAIFGLFAASVIIRELTAKP